MGKDEEKFGCGGVIVACFAVLVVISVIVNAIETALNEFLNWFEDYWWILIIIIAVIIAIVTTIRMYLSKRKEKKKRKIEIEMAVAEENHNQILKKFKVSKDFVYVRNFSKEVKSRSPLFNNELHRLLKYLQNKWPDISFSDLETMVIECAYGVEGNSEKEPKRVICEYCGSNFILNLDDKIIDMKCKNCGAELRD